jgi:hypothetical protein
MLIIHVLRHSAMHRPTNDILNQFRRNCRVDVAQVWNMVGYAKGGSTQNVSNIWLSFILLHKTDCYISHDTRYRLYIRVTISHIVFRSSLFLPPTNLHHPSSLGKRLAVVPSDDTSKTDSLAARTKYVSKRFYYSKSRMVNSRNSFFRRQKFSL